MSGGLDCVVAGWDPSTGNIITHFSSTPTTANPHSTQLANPPFVHQLAFTPSGSHLLGSLGNGQVCIWSLAQNMSPVQPPPNHQWDHNSKRKELIRLEGHSHAVVAMDMFTLHSNDAQSLGLVTTGNDGMIVLWDLSTILKPQEAKTLSDLPTSTAGLSKGQKKRLKAKKKAIAKAEAGDSKDDEENEDEDTKEAADSSSSSSSSSTPSSSLSSVLTAFSSLSLSSPFLSSLPASIEFSEKEKPAYTTEHMLYRFRHGQKPNSIACAHDSSNSQHINIYVADTTKDISVYQLK